MKKMKKFKIETTFDVAKFFIWLVFDKRLAFHPDDDFHEYVSYINHGRTFSDKESDYYNDIMAQCFEVCEKSGCEIYEIANNVFNLYNSCTKNQDNYEKE